jgi:IMP dehydrogenase
MHEKLKYDFEALTFDDVLLVPSASQVLPSSVDTSTNLAGVKLAVPLLSAPMDTVTEGDLAIALAREGGLGVIHRNLPVEEQARQVEKVKKSESWVVSDPITLASHEPVSRAYALMGERGVSGFPVVNEGRLVGILTQRDLRFTPHDSQRPVADFMTREVVTARPGVSLEQAKEILHAHRIEKLPLVREDGRLAGLITLKDISKAEHYPNATKDGEGRLRVAAAVGVNDENRVHALVKAGADLLCVDSAHGHAAGVLDAVRWIKRRYPELPVIGGNVSTEEGAEALIGAGADVVKVGQGPGSICSTRIVSGIGMPQVTAVWMCVKAAAAHGVPVIADGGIRYSGDIAKAIGAGAAAVMLGNLLAGTEETPGHVVFVGGRKYKRYRGMGSLGAMLEGGAARYGQAGVNSSKLVPEGVEGIVPYRGSVSEVVYQLVGGLRSGMGYCGTPTLRDLQKKARFVKISKAGQAESHPHSIQITSDAPNYSRPQDGQG